MLSELIVKNFREKKTVASIALLVGNSEYQNFQNLECCIADLNAIERLVRATQKHTTIKSLLNKSSIELKNTIREITSGIDQLDEFFFYFTGHGHQHDSEFYCCPSDFDREKPNETGLSNSELHELIRATNPEFVVKIIDACFSGSPLIKSDNGYLPVSKGVFRNLVQIASSLDTQESLGGQPLSKFTQSFQDSVLAPTAGPIYYLDIINSLKDKFITNDHQTPFFNLQGASREKFVDDARRFDEIRTQLHGTEGGDHEENETDSEQEASVALSTIEILAALEENMFEKVAATEYIDKFLTAVEEEFASKPLFADMYEMKASKTSYYNNSAMKPFMVRALKGEDRLDSFVTAETDQVERRDPYESLVSSLRLIGRRRETYTEYILKLNADFKNIEIQIIFTPKYKSLARFKLTACCAPSLSSCYVFEYLSKHRLEDWDSYEGSGIEVNRRWYQRGWGEGTGGILSKIYDYANLTLERHIDTITTETDP